MKNHSSEHHDSDWRRGTAYIVETRMHPNLPLVLDNVNRCLPKQWYVMVFCSLENYTYVKQAVSQLIDRRVQIIKLEKAIDSLASYNDLLFSNWFWEQFETENLLGFQVDSLFNEKQTDKLSQIAEYDYVGAPWSESIQRRWSYIPSYGGNGGICFSKRSARLTALDKATYPRVTGEPHHQILNEDIWFSHAFNELKLRLPERSLAMTFFVESVYSKEPFAVHKPWCYLAKKDYFLLSEKIPSLDMLRLGCEKKLQQTENLDYRRFLLRFARQCLKEDNYHQADLALQVCQSRFPLDPTAFTLQSTMAYNLGLFEQANQHVNKALALDSNLSRALENKKIIDQALEKQKAQKVKSNDRYLLIHSWGSGLGFDLLYLLKQLMVAELADRKPMIFWGKNSLYNDQPERNCFTDYFEPISDLSFNDIEPFQQECYPTFWQQRPLDDYIRRTRWRNKINQQNFSMTGLYYLNRPETLVVGGEFTSIKMLLPWVPKSHHMYGMSVAKIYRYLMMKYIRPQAHLKARANTFVDNAFSDKPFIAIHLRGTDKHQEKQSNDIKVINQTLIDQVDQLDKSLPIFVMTDDVRQISVMQNRFGSRVCSVDVTRSDGDELGVHHTASDKQKIAEEVIVDMLIASQSRYFYGCGFSYLACCVSAMRGNNVETTLLPFDVTNRFNDIPTQGTFGIQ